MRKIKFALEMEDDVKVRDVEELKENFSIVKVYEHYQSGKLQKWLESWYYDEILEAVQNLVFDEQNFVRDMCRIFEIEYQEDMDLHFQKYINKQKETERKLSVIKQYTSDESMLEEVELVACNQSDLEQLALDEKEKIYLCGEDVFEIDTCWTSKLFVGIGKPCVNLSKEDFLKANVKGMRFCEIQFKDEELQKYCEKHFADTLVEKMQLSTHKGKFYNGVFYGFTEEKIVVYKGNGSVEEKSLEEILGRKVTVKILDLDVDDEKIAILVHGKVITEILYVELSKYKILQVYEVRMYKHYEECLKNVTYEELKKYGLQMGKWCEECFSSVEVGMTLDLKRNHIICGIGKRDACLSPIYIIFDYIKDQICKCGRIDVSMYGGSWIKRFDENVVGILLEEYKIISSNEQFDGKTIVREGGL